MANILIKNAEIINKGKQFKAHVHIVDDKFQSIIFDDKDIPENCKIIDATGLLMLPGVIDDQVHFREPGLTHKGNIFSESRAAAAGGVTSFMEMPNTMPQTTNIDALMQKHEIAKQNSLVNYSFYLGATNDNISEIEKADPKFVCGIKMFMGSSTGNMLVSSDEAISAVFANSPCLVAAHCEDDNIINSNFEKYKSIYGDDIPMHFHADIRSAEACYASSSRAVELATKHNARLHILHLSTAKEIQLMQQKPLSDKKITGEVCVHHLWFNKQDYEQRGAFIKWNPSIKEEENRLALIEALKSDLIDIVATDHAPHTIEEKNQVYTKSPSGAPMVQHSLVAMLEMVKKGVFSYSDIVNFMCHKPADLFQVEKRGYIEPDYFADFVLVKPNSSWQINKSNILYKCAWSPLEGIEMHHKIQSTWVNGKCVYKNGEIIEGKAAMVLRFER
ncbi:MAG: dihydroorotase [Bacteroidales bacterium]|nr:dihydroorotase [Bacteroidales bacterium]